MGGDQNMLPADERGGGKFVAPVSVNQIHPRILHSDIQLLSFESVEVVPVPGRPAGADDDFEVGALPFLRLRNLLGACKNGHGMTSG